MPGARYSYGVLQEIPSVPGETNFRLLILNCDIPGIKYDISCVLTDSNSITSTTIAADSVPDIIHY